LASVDITERGAEARLYVRYTRQEQEQQAGAERFSCSCLLLLLLPGVSDIRKFFYLSFWAS